MSSCGAVGLPTAFPCGHRCTVGIDRDPPMCHDAQGDIKAKRQPLCGWCCLVVTCLGRDRRDVFGYILSDVRTENTYTHARLEGAVHKLSSQFVPSRIRGSRSLASDCVLNPSKHFRVEICSAAPRGSCCASPLYRSCANWQVQFSSFFVSMRSVFHS